MVITQPTTPSGNSEKIIIQACFRWIRNKYCSGAHATCCTHGHDQNLEEFPVLVSLINLINLLTLWFRRLSSWSPVATCRTPVQRAFEAEGRTFREKKKKQGYLSNGCPRAMAPPFTLTLSWLISNSRTQYTSIDAKASLI
jgi:hypothetical protein